MPKFVVITVLLKDTALAKNADATAKAEFVRLNNELNVIVFFLI